MKENAKMILTYPKDQVISEIPKERYVVINGESVGKKPRDPKCQRCKNHGEVVSVKYHTDCPRKDCICQACLKTVERQIKMRDQTANRREKIRKTELYEKEINEIHGKLHPDSCLREMKSYKLGIVTKELPAEKPTERVKPIKRKHQSDSDSAMSLHSKKPKMIKEEKTKKDLELEAVRQIEKVLRCSEQLLKSKKYSLTNETVVLMYIAIKACGSEIENKMTEVRIFSDNTEDF